MSDQHIETCPDNHHCLHGSKCVQNPYDEGSYYCDCDEVIWDVHYEGLFCEHKAEVYCTGIEDGINKHWFCTNGGTCIENPQAKSSGPSSWACDCPYDYEGSYCQFVRGSRPKGYPYTNNNISSNTQNGSSSPVAGAIIGSLVTIMVIATIGAALYYRRKLGLTRSSDGGITGGDLELDSDGSIMKDAISNSIQEDADWGRKNNNQERPSTRQSEAGLSYADSVNDDDSSMLSLT